jgi:two-component system response regulator AtoC
MLSIGIPSRIAPASKKARPACVNGEGGMRSTLDMLMSNNDMLLPNNDILEKMGRKDLEAREQDFLLSLSPKMRDISVVIDKVAQSDVIVLIRGESGTGKELVAKSLFRRSLRNDKPLIKVLCAALPEGLLESELFGHEKGAFTGAHRLKPGKFEFANQGTIFLDEIGDIHPRLQSKLLQVLQDGRFSRVGGFKEIQVNTRVIAATNRHLESAVAKGSFRSDLFFRLNIISILLPPLRERKEEIPHLVEYFRRRMIRENNWECPRVSDKLMDAFLTYNWPGNVRELENIVKRLALVGDVTPEGLGKIQEENSNGIVSALNTNADTSNVGDESMLNSGNCSLKEFKRKAKGMEASIIRKALEMHFWNRKAAAATLEISYKGLLNKIKEYGIY